MKDLENVRCLIRQACVDAFEKLFNEKAVRSWTEKVQDDIFSASLQLMDLATAKLEQVSQSLMRTSQSRHQHASSVAWPQPS